MRAIVDTNRDFIRVPNKLIAMLALERIAVFGHRHAEPPIAQPHHCPLRLYRRREMKTVATTKLLEAQVGVGSIRNQFKRDIRIIFQWFDISRLFRMPKDGSIRRQYLATQSVVAIGVDEVAFDIDRELDRLAVEIMERALRHDALIAATGSVLEYTDACGRFVGQRLGPAEIECAGHCDGALLALPAAGYE